MARSNQKIKIPYKQLIIGGNIVLVILLTVFLILLMVIGETKAPALPYCFNISLAVFVGFNVLILIIWAIITLKGREGGIGGEDSEKEPKETKIILYQIGRWIYVIANGDCGRM